MPFNLNKENLCKATLLTVKSMQMQLPTDFKKKSTVLMLTKSK